MKIMHGIHGMHGFTIVELVIVTIVIAILALIINQSYKGAQDRARAVVLADGARKVEKQFQLSLISAGQKTWPDDDTFSDPNSDGDNPTLGWLIDNTELGKHLPEVPQVPGIENTQWHYDWDLNPGSIENCVYPNEGTNIFVEGIPPAIVQRIDDYIDDGNISCGKVRYVNYHGEEQFTYKLSPDGNL